MALPPTPLPLPPVTGLRRTVRDLVLTDVLSYYSALLPERNRRRETENGGDYTPAGKIGGPFTESTGHAVQKKGE